MRICDSKLQEEEELFSLLYLAEQHKKVLEMITSCVTAYQE